MSDDARLMFYPEDKNFTNEEDRDYARERLVFNVTEDILLAMEFLNLSKSDLAKELNKSKSYVTQTLSGERNMTLGTLSDICFALNIKPVISIEANKPKAREVRAFKLICNPQIKQMTAVWQQKIQERPAASSREWSDVPLNCVGF